MVKDKLSKQNAFPGMESTAFGQDTGHYQGMTLRDYFAAKAMQSLISEGNLRGGISEYTIISRHAYCCADEMLKERGE
jgi:hypothetical protein